MYKLPQDFNKNDIVGSSIVSICHLEYQVDVNLSNDVTIHIEGRCSLFSGNTLLWEEDAFPISSSLLPRIVGKTVQNLLIDNNNTDIMLCLNGGLVFHIYGDGDQYESYRIFLKDGDIIV